jgi:hypothetical protein
MSQGLPVSDIVNVDIFLTPQAAQFANVDSLLIVGSSSVIDTVQRIRTYAGIAGVAADFGTSAPEYLAALNFFSQQPQPTQLYIGRWAQSATSGILQGAPLSASQQQMANFTPITNGGIDFTIDGVARNLTGLDFSSQTNLNGVAAVIATALSTHGTCTWNGTNFAVTSSSTGASSTVAFATTGGGTDISTLIGMTAASSGAYVVPGIIAETAVAAVALLDNLTTQWYGLMFASTHIVDADHLAIAAYIEATFHIYGLTTQEAGALVSNTTSDIGYQLAQFGYKRTFYQYSSSSAYAVASMFGREFTVDFNANNSVIILMFQQEPGVIPETLTPTQAASLNAKRYNYFVNYNNGTAIIRNGFMAGLVFIDQVHDLDWFSNALQTNVYNLFYQAGTKVPQTDPGVHRVVTTAEATCKGAVNNGIAAPGTWGGQAFGTLNPGDYMPTGFYVYAPPVSQQASADRAARKCPSLQIALKLAGGIQSAQLNVYANP